MENYFQGCSKKPAKKRLTKNPKEAIQNTIYLAGVIIGQSQKSALFSLFTIIKPKVWILG